MGLALEVGILADLKRADPEGFQYHADAMSRLNEFFAASGLPEHVEPTECEPWSGEMLGYSGLHDLRRIAAYLDCGAPLPSPSSGEAADDPMIDAYFASVTARRPGLLSRLFRSPREFRREFDHLIFHSDAQGYYLPIDFATVQFPHEELEIPGAMVGSVPRLTSELLRIARALGIPETLTTDTELLWEIADAPPKVGPKWQQYGRETFGCVTLLEGCRKSLELSAALVFT
jgi:hypothetical protein